MRIDFWVTNAYLLIYVVVGCPHGQIHFECMNFCPQVCGSPAAVCPRTCNDGCFCPKGTAFTGSSCVKPEKCPCKHEGRHFNHGQTIRKDCNTW